MSTGSANWAAARAEKTMPPLMAEMAARERASEHEIVMLKEKKELIF